MNTELFFVVTIVFLIAGIVKGISGMGLPTVSMALLSLLMSPAKAALLMVMPSLATNITQCLGRHWLELIRRFWAMWLALALTTVFIPIPGVDEAGQEARLMLGIILIAYGLWGLFKPALSKVPTQSILVTSLVGALSGLITAATGVFVIPMVPYLQLLNIEKDKFIQALGISFTVATLALAARFGLGNFSSLIDSIYEVFVALVAAFIGLSIGSRLRGKLNPTQFQKALFCIFIILGLIMSYRVLLAR